MRPPAPSTAPAISPTPRRSVPLKSMCSWKWARPSSPGALVGGADPRPDLHLDHRRDVQLAQQHGETAREHLGAHSLERGAPASAGRRVGSRGRSKAGGRVPFFPWARSASTCTFRSASACAPTATSRSSRPGRSPSGTEERYVAALLARARGAARGLRGPRPRERLLRRRHAGAAPPAASVARLVGAIRARFAAGAATAGSR